MTRATRGILGAGGALFASALVYFLAHAGMSRTALPVFLFYWYALSLPLFAAFSLGRPEASPFRFSPKRPGWTVFYFAVEISAVVVFFMAMRLLPPAVASFASPTNILFTVLLGIFILKERFLLSEAGGGALIIAGMTMIVHTSEVAGRLGMILLLTSNFLWALAHVCVKKIVETNDPLALAHLRAIIFTILSGGYLALSGRPPVIDSAELFWILLAGAFFGPFLNMVLRYSAVRNIEVSKVALIAAQTPVAAVAIAFALGTALPGPREVLGGLLALTGSIALIKAKLKAEKFAARKSA